MNWADWTIVGVFSVSALIGLARGFVKEALSLLVLVSALVIAFVLDDKLAVQISQYIQTPSLRQISAFSLLFIATWLVGAMIVFLIGELVKMTGLSGTDRTLGMVFGLARAFVLILVLVVWMPKLVPVDQDPWWQASILVPEFQKFEGWFHQITNELGRLWQQYVVTAEKSL
ncbi:MAG: CvpA family protein [Pseudomonadales bacterium]|nr:CvpA family protein [Pseudomonadales bacterium]